MRMIALRFELSVPGTRITSVMISSFVLSNPANSFGCDDLLHSIINWSVSFDIPFIVFIICSVFLPPPFSIYLIQYIYNNIVIWYLSQLYLCCIQPHQTVFISIHLFLHVSIRISHFAHVSRNSLILPLVSIITFTALLSRARGLAGYDTAFTRRGSCVRIASGPPKLHFIYTFQNQRRGCGLVRYGDGLQRINDEQRIY